MVVFSVLGSGSCGNSYMFSCNGQSLLVDAGFSYRQLSMRAGNAGLDIATVKALLLTHLHPDHNRGAGVFARKTGLPVYVSSKCIKYAAVEYRAMNLPEESCFVFEEGVPFKVGDDIGGFEVSAFYTSHDSAGSVGYEIRCDSKTFVVVTDTGVYSPSMLEAAGRADVLFLESNYDEEMLRRGPYPLYLQRRIAGERGHLSNEQARRFLCECGFEGSGKPVYLVHLSQNNNEPSLVRDCMVGFNAHVCERGLQYSGELA